MGKYCLWAFGLIWVCIIAGKLGNGMFAIAASGQVGLIGKGILYLIWAICCIVALPGFLICKFLLLAYNDALPMPLRIVPIIVAFIFFYWLWRL